MRRKGLDLIEKKRKTAIKRMKRKEDISLSLRLLCCEMFLFFFNVSIEDVLLYVDFHIIDNRFSINQWI